MTGSDYEFASERLGRMPLDRDRNRVAGIRHRTRRVLAGCARDDADLADLLSELDLWPDQRDTLDDND